MKKLRTQGLKFAIAALSLALTACGGGGGDAPDKPQAAQPAPKTVLIEAYGDSTTKGVNVQPSEAPPAVTQQIMQRALGAGVSVANHGVSGTQASQLLYGTDGVHPPWQQQMAASKADIVTLNFGLNDAYYSNPGVAAAPGVPRENPQLFADALTALIAIAKAHGKQVVIFEPNPSCLATIAAVLPNFIYTINAVAANQGVRVVREHEYILGLAWQSMTPDCVHPDAQLYAIKAQLEVRTLQPIVESLLANPS